MKNFKHQTEVFDRFKNKKYGALFLETGTGKTRIVIQLANHHFTQDRVTATLVVTTRGLMGNWNSVELPKHSDIPYRTYLWNVSKDIPYADSTHLYFLVNIDALPTDRFAGIFKDFMKKHPAFTLIIDESTVVKNPRSARTRAALKVGRYATARYVLSGTPIVQSPLDVYSQCEILTESCLGIKGFIPFKARYAEIKRMTFGPRSFDKIVGYKHLDELTERIKSVGVIIKKDECLDLPPKMYRTIDVPLTPAQQRAYDDLKQRALAYIQDHQISVVNTVSLINKLLQICCGQLKVGDDYLQIENNRLDVLKELIDRAGGPTLIWTSYVNTAYDIKEKLGDDVVHLPSGTSTDERETILASFRKGNYKALVANPASAGHGITLVESNSTIYFSNSFNLEHRLQSEARNHRAGQTNSVLYTDLIAKGTIEERVVSILKEKKQLADLVITNDAVKKLLED
jgi:SNF2 family DNA or RNA helicase